jgi:hypothetical protein
MFMTPVESAKQKIKTFLEEITWIGTYKIVDIDFGNNFTIAFTENADAEKFQAIMESAGATANLYSCH